VKELRNKIYYMLLTGCWCMSVGDCMHTFGAYVREIVNLMVPDDLGYVSQLNNVLFDGRACVCLKGYRAQCVTPVPQVQRMQKLRIRGLHLHSPHFFAALCVIQQCDKLNFTSHFCRENACLEDCIKCLENA
jgi:hypothetical protein